MIQKDLTAIRRLFTCDRGNPDPPLRQHQDRPRERFPAQNSAIVLLEHELGAFDPQLRGSLPKAGEKDEGGQSNAQSYRC